MAVPAETVDRTTVARNRIAAIVALRFRRPGDGDDSAAAALRSLAEQWAYQQSSNHGGNIIAAVADFLELAAQVGQVRVGCRRDGVALTVRVQDEPEQEVDFPQARGRLRAMCAHLAVLSSRPDGLPPLYGGVAYVPPPNGQPHGFTLKMMNTMGEHWFDLAYQGETA
jgi:hypothetical protein